MPPSAETGHAYKGPIAVDKTTTITAVAWNKSGLASSPAYGTYLIDPKQGLSSFHIGNSLTNTTAQFPIFCKTANINHKYQSFTAGGRPDQEAVGRRHGQTQGCLGQDPGDDAQVRHLHRAAARFQHRSGGGHRHQVLRTDPQALARVSALALLRMGREEPRPADRQGDGTQQPDEDALPRPDLGRIDGRDAALRRGTAAQDRRNLQGRQEAARAAQLASPWAGSTT